MHRRVFLKTAPVVVLPLLPGCKTVMALLKEGLKDPEVKIVGMKLGAMALDAIEALFDVEIKNPNPVGIKLSGVDYTLTLEEKKLAEGSTTTPLDLPADDTATTSFDVRFPLATLGENLLVFLEKKEAAYVVDAIFKIGAGEATLGIPGRFEGMVPLPKPPVVEVKKLKVDTLDTSGVTFKLDTRVTNPNVFDLLVDRLHLTIDLNGHEVVKNREVAGVKITPSGVADVPLAFTVSLAGLGLGLAALLEKPEISWAVDFLLESGEAKLPFVHEGTIKLAARAVGRAATSVAVADRRPSARAG